MGTSPGFTPATPTPTTPNTPGQATGDQYRPSPHLADTIVNFLIRLACSLNEPLEKKGLAFRCIELLQEYCQSDLFPEMTVKLSYLEKVRFV